GPHPGLEQHAEHEEHDAEEHQRLNERPDITESRARVLQLELSDRELTDEVEIPRGCPLWARNRVQRFSLRDGCRGVPQPREMPGLETRDGPGRVARRG